MSACSFCGTPYESANPCGHPLQSEKARMAECVANMARDAVERHWDSIENVADLDAWAAVFAAFALDMHRRLLEGLEEQSQEIAELQEKLDLVTAQRDEYRNALIPPGGGANYR